MATKLYPPVIEGVLPAFYLDYNPTGAILKGGALTVPFTMNATVAESQVKGFSLRIRTASSGSYILPPIYSNVYSLAKGEVTFNFTPKQASVLTEGQYYKIQIAYCGRQLVDEAGNVSGADIGYYSTVGVAKCTSKASVTIRGLQEENINAFNNEFYGVYDLENCKDRTEKVYSYEFKIYDEEENIFFTSGEILHKAYYDTDYVSSVDRIIVNDFASTDVVYSIEYNVTTINGLKLSSPKYRVTSQYLVSSNADIKIVPEADEENGIIIVHFEGGADPERSYHYVINEDTLMNLEIDDEGNPKKDDNGKTMATVTEEAIYTLDNLDKLTYLRQHTLFKHFSYDAGAYFYTYLPNNPPKLTAFEGKYYRTEDIEGFDLTPAYLSTIDSWKKMALGKDLLKSMTYQYVEENFINLGEMTVIASVEAEKKYYGSYLLSRASDEDNYTTWFNVARFKLDDQVPSTFSLKDVTIEHGHKYKYALQQYNIWGLYSARIVSDIFEASFEDAFLFDGEKWLKIRYNPTIDSFKTTILEQKTDTLGGQYPFITRNGATYYKEFPIGGLLAHELDEYHYFVDPEWENTHRHSSSDDHAIQPANAYWNQRDFSDATIGIERNFKLRVLEWLNNGKPKLFKSPYEGNYIVRLMNNSLTPVKELGRMLHSFQSQAYEIAECTYENLVAYGFITTNMPSDLVNLWRSYDLQDPNLLNADGSEIIIALDTGIKNFTIQDMMPGDIIYLTFSEEVEEMPIMIGITGSYTYENINRTLVKIRIPVSTEHKMVGIINCFYSGMRITDFDSIISMQLKTIISQQYIGVSPWMQALKRTNWEAMNNLDIYVNYINSSQFQDLQNYNFRTYLERTVSPLGQSNYYPSENFAKLARSFDPGELLDRMNLSIHQDERYKTEVVNMEILRFRERPLIPVFTHQNRLGGQPFYVPGEYEDSITKRHPSSNATILMVATTPYGVPHPIEHLAEIEMLDPFCMFEVLEQDYQTDDWIPIRFEVTPYYDPYYRTWMSENYDPNVKMGLNWVQVVYFDRFGTAREAVRADNDSLYLYNGTVQLKTDTEEYKELSTNSLLSTLIGNQDYLLMAKDARYLYRKNIIHQNNKAKKARGEFIDQAINEQEMYDYELQVSYFDETYRYNHYYYNLENNQVEIINENSYDLFEKVNNKYIAWGKNQIESNKVYWVKKYDINLNMTTEKEIEYRNTELLNSYHIGNGVVAECTFQLRVIDYYTEIYDEDVRIAKENYLEAKEFYTTLMQVYNTIRKANSERQINHAFMELYYRMLFGNSSAMDQDEISSIYNVLNHELSREELKLQSLYNITMINSSYDSDAIKLLVELKKKCIEIKENAEDDSIISENKLYQRIYPLTQQETLQLRDFKVEDIFYNNAEIYYYFESTDTKVIDQYYVLFKSDFYPENNNSLYIWDTKYAINIDAAIEDEDNYITYRYKYYGDGLVYYYKVKKQNYINDYMNESEEHQLMNPKDLVIVYDVANEQFVVKTKNDVIATGSELYELQKQTASTITNYIDLLNDDEVAALKIEDYFLGINLVTDNNYKLYEITEIEDILHDRDLDGAQNKLTAISYEINKITDDLSDRQTKIDTMSIDYITAYLNMLKAVDGYNTKVYKDWCARYAAELLFDASGNSTGVTKNDILDECEKILSATDVEISTKFVQTNRLIVAASNLYEVIAGDIPTLEVYTKMINDTIEDETHQDLDNYLEDQIYNIRGRIVLSFLAMRQALYQVFEILEDSHTSDIDNPDEYKSLFNSVSELVPKYNILYNQLITNNQFNNEYRDIERYLSQNYEKYQDLLQSERAKYYADSTYLDLENLADISNIYDDITLIIDDMYDKQNNKIVTNYSSTEYINFYETNDNNIEEVTTLILVGFNWNTDNVIFNQYKNRNRTAQFFNPLYDSHSYNFFYLPINNGELSNKMTLEGQSFKNTNTYFYRSSLVLYVGNEDIVGSEATLFTRFIFNPTGTGVKDLSIGDYTNNKTYFDSLSETKQQDVLTTTQKLITIMKEVVKEAASSRASLERRYMGNYIIDRNKLINPPMNAGDTPGAVYTLGIMVDGARDTILNTYPSWLISGITPPFMAAAFEFFDYNITSPYYYLIPFNDNSILLEENFASEDDYEQALKDQINNSNWNQDLHISEDILKKSTQVITDEKFSSGDMEEYGIYWDYINLFYITETDRLNQLLENAQRLQRLYQKQVDVYTGKLDTYSTDYELNQQLYSSYFGTEAFSYYNSLNNANLTQEERDAIIERYKNKVQLAWWAFLNLLDARYSAEKERGMYL